MPLDFPTPPSLNQVYSFGGKSWKWNGAAWETYNDNLGVDFVETVNGITGEVGVEGGTDISVVASGQTLTINYTGSSVSNAVTSFNGVTGAVQGVSSANGLTGAVTFHAGAGITLSTSGGGISFAIHYGPTGASSFYTNVSPTNPDRLLVQLNSTGEMRTVTYSTLLTKAAQVGDILSTTTTYTPNITKFVVQNTSSGVTEMVSADNVFSIIDAGFYDGSMPVP
jgi:hypothetical protein